MLDIMLANGKSGFSSGETAALFGPYRHHHVEFHDQSAAADGLQWQELLGAGPDELY
jgi:hypothetical protein